jgi:hypothetical protein
MAASSGNTAPCELIRTNTFGLQGDSPNAGVAFPKTIRHRGKSLQALGAAGIRKHALHSEAELLWTDCGSGVPFAAE